MIWNGKKWTWSPSATFKCSRAGIIFGTGWSGFNVLPDSCAGNGTRLTIGVPATPSTPARPQVVSRLRLSIKNCHSKNYYSTYAYRLLALSSFQSDVASEILFKRSSGKKTFWFISSHLTLTLTTLRLRRPLGSCSQLIKLLLASKLAS